MLLDDFFYCVNFLTQILFSNFLSFLLSYITIWSRTWASTGTPCLVCLGMTNVSRICVLILVRRTETAEDKTSFILQILLLDDTRKPSKTKALHCLGLKCQDIILVRSQVPSLVWRLKVVRCFSNSIRCNKLF